ncbi:hypothetical protein [Burkholderia diffusa]|uniref:hypothetical protein n=1 Tax=Burkholderia diffusa TaxID=488732 RepID=UPI00157B6AC9|nr:hypothetical protein [Burkholderia diffusa]NTY38962.1 hypothetical protein [Burkholderia diffusa]
MLTALAQKCPQIDKDFAYYKQTYNGYFKKISSVFTDLYREWAWSKGKDEFPADPRRRTITLCECTSHHNFGLKFS